jgi:hypothetical protein
MSWEMCFPVEGAPSYHLRQMLLEDLGPVFVQVEEDGTAKAALQVYLDELESRLGAGIATVTAFLVEVPFVP